MSAGAAQIAAADAQQRPACAQKRLLDVLDGITL